MSTLRTRLLSAVGLIAAGLTVIGGALLAQPAVLVRGPYLQTGTPTGVIVRWRTSTPSDAVVRYGTAPGQLTQTAAQAAVTTEHHVALTGLTPHTRYFYAVGSSTAVLAGGDLDHSFVTAPPTGTRVPTRIWVLGDSGTADAAVRRVRDGALGAMRDREPDLWMMLGDNAYSSGTDAEYQAAVFDVFAATLRRAVLWPTFGNHDAISADAATRTGPYFDLFTLPTGGEAGGVASGTEAYYSFDYGNVHIVCLDSTESDRGPTGPMVTWLRQDLAARTAEWTIVFFHHPPYSKGTHDSDTERELIEMRESVAPVLEEGGVDLVLAGHSHSYERSTFLHGHYGPSSTFGPQFQVDGGSGNEATSGAYRKVQAPGARGTVYVVAGNSGFGSGSGTAHPAMPYTVFGWGSLVIDVDGPRLVVRFLGNSIPAHAVDAATLIKHAPSGPPGAPTGAVRASAGSGRVVLRWDGGGGGLPQEYVIEAGTAPGRRDLGVVGTGSLSASLQAQAGPGRYFVRARARNADGLGPPSPDTDLVLDARGNMVPPAPTVRTHGVFGSVVTVGYEAATALTPVRGHVLEVGTSPGRRDLVTFPVEFGGFTATGVPPGVYYGRLRAFNSAGEGPPSREMQFVVGGVPAVPDAPGYPRALAQGSTVTITWPPPRTGSPAVRYAIEAGVTPGASDVRLVTTDATPGVVVTGVPPGTYYVRVRGENALGLGLLSVVTRIEVP